MALQSTPVTTAASAPPSSTGHFVHSRTHAWLGLLVGTGLLLGTMLGSIVFGAADIVPRDVGNALFAFEATSTAHLIVRTLRIPRAIVAVLVGAALAVAGTITQGLTRNPLGDPGLLGINAGAALAVVAAVFFFDIGSLSLYALWAFAGAALATVTVYGLGSLGQGGPTPFNLTMAGAAVTALLSSCTTGVLILNQRTLEEVRFWLAGSVAGRGPDLVLQALPYLAGGLGLALLLGRQITTLSLGEDVARGLGQHTGWIKGLAFAAVLLLSGSAVAVAGPIGFVGLAIPHAARFLVGVDYRWILPYSILMGGIFLLLADVGARLVLRPLELPIGVMTALIGGPFFIYLVRWRVKR